MIYRDSKIIQSSPLFFASHATNHTYHSLSVTACHPSHYHQSQPHWVVILLANKRGMYMLYTTIRYGIAIFEWIWEKGPLCAIIVDFDLVVPC